MDLKKQILSIVRLEPGLTTEEIRQRMKSDDGGPYVYEPSVMCRDLDAQGRILRCKDASDLYRHFPIGRLVGSSEDGGFGIIESWDPP